MVGGSQGIYQMGEEDLRMVGVLKVYIADGRGGPQDGGGSQGIYLGIIYQYMIERVTLPYV